MTSQHLEPAVPPASASPLILDVDGLTADHGTNRVVNGVSFRIQEGEFVTLLGPSGCGKTTTLRCVAGLHRASGGSISIDGRLVADARSHVRPEHRSLNMVFQSYALWPHMTVAQNIAYGLKAQKVDKQEIGPRVEEVLQLVGLGGYGKRSASQLSGGQQQRVVLARGLATRPRLLLLDEPLSNLDSELRSRMRTEIHTLQRSLGLTTLYVTHDRAEALALSDRVIVLREGVVQQVGPPGTLYDKPANRFVAEALGPVNVLRAVVTGAGTSPAAQLTGVEGAPTFPIAAGTHEAVVGREIEVLVRPEALTLAPAGLPGADEFPATVTVVEFLGNRTEVTCTAGGSEFKIDLDGRPVGIERGDMVNVSLRKERAASAPGWQPVG
ncbi:iron(III) transport system ATP-binding protein/putative spermidine/putrescine transport system ATP-binding protein [Actinacidiphila yanglinensis]|uniref:Iron(III) transport system ATP-binding protein/putative spermidine/putrescine transport system ATP-binding protein n=1 Tax=Actinacidiphila yanglinensis TaxID=310779 RepID=A0A1H6CHI7_9ACTN|nr:ABC transporter ATP-binding protein [Actinacidiphila yanglinensis]SEG72490.1 iron(III) transport system ATP-binding protein/putative spermidine/putrescine transport system ATP-binding protein [Actinacidiphila yanglinensis]